MTKTIIPKHLISQVIARICKQSDVRLSDLDLKTRQREIVQARQKCHYILWLYSNMSLSNIGQYIGGKDHATVLHSVKTMLNLIDTDPDIRKDIDDIESYIKQSTKLHPISSETGQISTISTEAGKDTIQPLQNEITAFLSSIPKIKSENETLIARILELEDENRRIKETMNYREYQNALIEIDKLKSDIQGYQGKIRLLERKLSYADKYVSTY